MLPVLEVPIGRGLGLLLLLAAAAWWWAFGRAAPWASPRRRLLAAALLGPAVLLLAAGPVGVLPLPVYGACMALGTAAAVGLGGLFARERGLAFEPVVDLALVGIACGLGGGRVVHVLENWSTKFTDAPPGRASPGVVEPLAPGDALVLWTHAGEARVEFTGAERTAQDVLDRVTTQAAAADVLGRLVVARHRGEAGVEEAVRGLYLRTGRGGRAAWLEVVPGPAQRKLGLEPGRSVGRDTPLLRLLDLSEGGLTYFGAAIGVLLGWTVYLRRKRLPALGVLDAICPVLALGLFFGRVGCLARGCCFGREAGPHALWPVTYPAGSLPWQQLAGERLSVAWDPALAERTLTPALREALGPLADGTPPLHATQLYEGVGVLLIFFALIAYRRLLQRAVGQCFLLLVLLQAPLRFVDEHLRRDHDVFLPVLGYPMTESQVVAVLAVLAAAPFFVWFQRHGAPLATAGPLVPRPAPAAPPAPSAPAPSAPAPSDPAPASPA